MIMDKNLQTEPTKSELEILQVLWKFGPSTVRFVTTSSMSRKGPYNTHRP